MDVQLIREFCADPTPVHYQALPENIQEDLYTTARIAKLLGDGDQDMASIIYNLWYRTQIMRFYQRYPEDWQWFEYYPLKPFREVWVHPMEFFTDAITQQGFRYTSARKLHAKFAAYLRSRGVSWNDTVAIAEMSEAELVKVGFSKPKAKVLKNVAQVLSSYNEEEIKLMSPEQVYETFLPIKGIGKWSLQYWLIHYFHQPLMFSEDRLTRLGLQHMFKLPKLPTVKQSEKICRERWGNMAWFGAMIAMSVGGLLYHKRRAPTGREIPEGQSLS